MAVPLNQIEQYIRQAAQQRGIDPDTAVRVARSEGLAPGVWQSNLSKNGQREPSYGPFQLLVGGGDTGYPTGMGNDFVQATGKHPSDPSTVYSQVDFALDRAKSGGWTPWYGAKNSGIDRWAGIGGAPSGRLGGDSMVPRDHSAQVAAQTNSPFGSMFPGGGGTQPPAGIDPNVAQYAFGEEKDKKNRLEEAGKHFEAAMPGAPPRPPAFPGGPSEGQANGLLALMQSPNALARMFLSKRMG